MGKGAVAAIAGRRIDAAGTPRPAFPLGASDDVQAALAAWLRAHDVRATVSAAACGADLLAIAAAEALEIPFYLVLPFGVAEFRRRSVVDRPGAWGPVFDRLAEAARAAGRLHVLPALPDERQALEAANRAILDDAVALARRDALACRALVVWEGRARADHDYTAAFAAEAQQRGLPVDTLTIPAHG